MSDTLRRRAYALADRLGKDDRAVVHDLIGALNASEEANRFRQASSFSFNHPPPVNLTYVPLKPPEMPGEWERTLNAFFPLPSFPALPRQSGGGRAPVEDEPLQKPQLPPKQVGKPTVVRRAALKALDPIKPAGFDHE